MQTLFPHTYHSQQSKGWFSIFFLLAFSKDYSRNLLLEWYLADNVPVTKDESSSDFSYSHHPQHIHPDFNCSHYLPFRPENFKKIQTDISNYLLIRCVRTGAKWIRTAKGDASRPLGNVLLSLRGILTN